tara:strand:+ start:447 stop:1052 length:606 start_codon:yes stop_codon:yes gene_type:complete
MVNFENPWFLLLLFFLPFYIFLKWSGNEKNEGLIKISSVSFISQEIRNRGLFKYRIIIIMQVLVIVLIVLGMARPQLVGKVQESKVEVIDLIMVLDISSSMLADDFKPNRLEVVKKTASEFVRMRDQDRIGIMSLGKPIPKKGSKEKEEICCSIFILAIAGPTLFTARVIAVSLDSVIVSEKDQQMKRINIKILFVIKNVF